MPRHRLCGSSRLDLATLTLDLTGSVPSRRESASLAQPAGMSPEEGSLSRCGVNLFPVASVRFFSWMVLAAVFVLIAAAIGLFLTEGGSPGIEISVVFLIAVAIPAATVLLLSYLFGGIRRLRNQGSHRFANRFVKPS